MGQVLASNRDADAPAPASMQQKQQPLLQPAMEGDLDEIKVLIGRHIAVVTDDGDGAAPPPQPSPSDGRAPAVVAPAAAVGDGDGDVDGGGEGGNGNRRHESSDDVDPIIREFVDRPDGQGNRPLHGAVFGGHLPVVRFLVEMCGADVAARNGLGCSPLWLAAGYGHVDTLLYLIGVLKWRGVDVVGGALNGPNDAGDTPLLAAASRGHVDACRALLEAAAAGAAAGDGSDDEAEAGRPSPQVPSPAEMLRARNKGGDTCLTVAVGGSGGPDCAPLLDLLLEWDDAAVAGGNEDEPGPAPSTRAAAGRLVDERNSRGLTPLLVACERGHADVARHLAVRHGADVTLSDKDSASPLAVAVFCGHLDVARAILDLPDGRGRALLDEPNRSGCTPLWLAARTGNVAMVEWLTSEGVGSDASIANSDGLTPRQAAEKYDKRAVVEWFSGREAADI